MARGEHLKGKGGPHKFGTHVPTNLGGRKPKLKMIDFIEEAQAMDGKVIFEADKCEVLPDGRVMVQFPHDQIIAYNMLKKAASGDPRFLDIYMKTMGYYAPKKEEHRQIDENGNTINPPVIVFSQSPKEILKTIDKSK